MMTSPQNLSSSPNPMKWFQVIYLKSTDILVYISLIWETCSVSSGTKKLTILRYKSS